MCYVTNLLVVFNLSRVNKNDHAINKYEYVIRRVCIDVCMYVYPYKGLCQKVILILVQAS
jgi:hypothetical protein